MKDRQRAASRRSLALGLIAVVGVLLGGYVTRTHHGSSEHGQSPAARDLASTAEVVDQMLATFEQTHHRAPAQLSVDRGVVQVSRGPVRDRTELRPVPEHVRVVWFAEHPDHRLDRDAASVTGWSYCLADGAYSRRVSQSSTGVVISGPLKRRCPAPPTRS